MNKTLKAVFATLPLFACTLSFGQQPTINVVTSAVPFMRVSPDARAGGMGDLGIATIPDANSTFWNLAKTPFIDKKAGLALTYTPWLKDLGVSDVFLAALAGYYKLDDESAISTSLRFFNLGDIQFTDFNGNPLSTGKPTELAIDLGYSRKLSDRWSIGAALRYINSNLARGFASSSGVVYQAGSTVAGDVSLFHDATNEMGKGWRFGAALSNLGGKIGYTNNAQEKDYIPANLGIGASYTAAFDEDNKLTFGVDVNKLLVPTPPIPTGDSAVDATALLNYRSKGVVSSWFSSFGDAPGGFSEELKELQFSAGAEYSYADQFFVRAGYFYEDRTKGNRKFATVGVGVKFSGMGLNFSYLVPSGSGTNRNPLSNTLRFTLNFDLDGN
ncbi:MAG TPA: type IX secretion system outer membrane channel protein PorV [Phnomibacter sp.]|nr:type IX secretion system outer membrane channel protein PorV [Phnomibacter sp.]